MLKLYTTVSIHEQRSRHLAVALVFSQTVVFIGNIQQIKMSNWRGKTHFLWEIVVIVDIEQII